MHIQSRLRNTTPTKVLRNQLKLLSSISEYCWNSNFSYLSNDIMANAKTTNVATIHMDSIIPANELMIDALVLS